MRLGRAALTIALLASAVACSAQISGGGQISVGDVDAQPAPPVAIDASLPPTLPPPPPPPPVDAAVAIDAPPAPVCSQRTLFLNFDGQTLTSGTSDATANQASWLNKAQGTAPRYLTNDTGRDAKIQAIADGVRAQLAMFPITVVTTRPASGEYVMVVLGGQANQIGSQFSTAVNTLDCSDAQHNDVAWISDIATPSQHVINLVIGAVGLGIGLTATTDPNDCMCGWGNSCTPTNTACTLGTAIARDNSIALRCSGGAATQDEVATLRTAFCGP
jgi:hypothetical protein